MGYIASEKATLLSIVVEFMSIELRITIPYNSIGLC